MAVVGGSPVAPLRVVRRPVEVLGGAADLAFVDELQESAVEEFRDVVVDGAERGLQLDAEVLGGEGAAPVELEDFED
jgi:hypothetical protein